MVCQLSIFEITIKSERGSNSKNGSE